MKHLSLLRKTALACGIFAATALVSSCGSSNLAPAKAAQRITNSPAISVYSHNDMNSPKWRDCYEAGPLPERAERALVTWLHNSTLQEFSYIYPQYFITTTNSKGGGEVVWALCSDGRGNLVGVLAPSSKHTPAWDLPTIGGYKLFVCDTPEREALSTAIMESLADAGYDKVRIDTRKAQGVVDKDYLLSKPLNATEQEQLEKERKAQAKALADAKKKAEEEKNIGSSSEEEEEEDDTSSDDSSGSDDDSSSSDGEDDDSGASSDEGDDDSSSDDEDE